MSNRTKAILINAALLTACIVQLVRGYRPLIIAVAGLTMFLVANLIIWIKIRADFRRRNPNYIGRFAMHAPGEGRQSMREAFTPRERDDHRMDGPK